MEPEPESEEDQAPRVTNFNCPIREQEKRFKRLIKVASLGFAWFDYFGLQLVDELLAVWWGPRRVGRCGVV